jgi:rfaE bifunctional protein kinase chain/domain
MILDEYIHGRTDRVSREAPVVIVRYEGSTFAPGGAANAAQNVAALGGVAVPIGVVGADDAADRLAGLLEDRGVSTRGLVAAAGRVTTSKIRVSAGDYHAQHQQIVRIDKERRRPLTRPVRERLLRLIAREADRADAVILSDYHQDIFDGGIAPRAVAVCRKARVPVIADSRFRLPDFEGVTAATPNEVEAAEAAGAVVTDELALETVGRSLLKRLSASAILITRGRFGMSLFERRRRTRSIGVFGHPEATDVTGAGDTVVSAVALTLAGGGKMRAAMHLANAAAARVVMKRGTAVTSAAEIEELLDEIVIAGGSVVT